MNLHILERRIFLILLPVCYGYKYFQDQIPNGGLVPNPCKPNHLWQGVGHLVPGGGGKRNPYGQDFSSRGKTWTTELCKADSDGDGKTNGEELGDPDCTWTPGTVPKVTTGLSHPGICEPVGSATCRQENKLFGDVCKSAEEEIPCLGDIKKRADVKTWDVVGTESQVPAKETTYMCKSFSVPDDVTDYHVIAAQPIIDNAYVTHHIVIFGCQQSLSKDYSSPTECGMTEEACRDVISLWTVGNNGFCYNENFGFRIGKSGYKTFIMQKHWNNPTLASGYTDSSGMRLFYTPKLREHDGGLLNVGQSWLRIPGNRDDVTVEGVCSAECTSPYPHPLYIASSMLHMHYLGYRGRLEHSRAGRVINTLILENSYSYDSPREIIHEEPVKFMPGDELRLVCQYNSTSRPDVTYAGEGTRDEMCFGFITYYPALPSNAGCLQFRDSPFCPALGASPTDDYVFNNCSTKGFFSTKAQGIFAKVAAACDSSGAVCRDACADLLSDLAGTEPCMAGDAYYFTKFVVRKYYGDAGTAILGGLESCEKQEPEVDVQKETSKAETTSENSLRETGLPADWQTPGLSVTSIAVTVVVVIVVLIIIIGLFIYKRLSGRPNRRNDYIPVTRVDA